jgi:hypothetical protein
MWWRGIKEWPIKFLDYVISVVSAHYLYRIKLLNGFLIINTMEIQPN